VILSVLLALTVLPNLLYGQLIIVFKEAFEQDYDQAHLMLIQNLGDASVGLFESLREETISESTASEISIWAVGVNDNDIKLVFTSEASNQQPSDFMSLDPEIPHDELADVFHLGYVLILYRSLPGILMLTGILIDSYPIEFKLSVNHGET
jgi:hypothetical protein